MNKPLQEKIFIDLAALVGGLFSMVSIGVGAGRIVYSWKGNGYMHRPIGVAAIAEYVNLTKLISSTEKKAIFKKELSLAFLTYIPLLACYGFNKLMEKLDARYPMVIGIATGGLSGYLLVKYLYHRIDKSLSTTNADRGTTVEELLNDSSVENKTDVEAKIETERNNILRSHQINPEFFTIMTLATGLFAVGSISIVKDNATHNPWLLGLSGAGGIIGFLIGAMLCKLYENRKRQQKQVDDQQKQPLTQNLSISGSLSSNRTGFFNKQNPEQQTPSSEQETEIRFNHT